MTSDASKYSLSEILIHKDEMLLIDEIENFEESSLSSKVYITEKTEFLDENNQVPSWIGIEYMAQTIAAWAGITHCNKGDELKKGYLLGCRSFDAHVSHFPLGSELTVSVEKTYEGNDIGVFSCSISSDQLLAEASLNVYQPQ